MDVIEKANLNRQEQLNSHLKDLDTGDLILFSRDCSNFSPYGAILCLATKLVHQTEWDHIGIVLKNKNGDLKLLEAGFKGVRLYNLEERVARSKALRIAVRQLECVRTPGMQEQAWKFADEVAGRPYNYDVGQVVRAATTHPPKSYRRYLLGRILQLDSQIQKLEGYLQSPTLTPFLTHSLSYELEKARKQRAETFERLSSTERSFIENREDTSNMFCSELVAACYQQMGLLPKLPASNDYIPRDFASEGEDRLALPAGCWLYQERDIRRGGHLLKRSGTQEAGIRPSTQEEKKFLTAALKADPRCAHLSLQEIAHLIPQFKLVEMDSGAVLLSEIKHGHNSRRLYVVEKGKAKAYLRKNFEKSLVATSFGPGNCLFGDEYAHIDAKENLRCWKIDIDLVEQQNLKVNSLSFKELEIVRDAVADHVCFKDSQRLETPILFRPIMFETGQPLAMNGELACFFGVVLEGEAEVTTATGKHIMNLHPGATFGETSLLFDLPRGSIIRAKTPCRIGALGKAQFLQIVDSSPFFHMRDFFMAHSSGKHGDPPKKRMTEQDLKKAMKGSQVAVPKHILDASDLRRLGYLSLSDFLHFDILLARKYPELEMVMRLACNSAGVFSISKDQYMQIRKYAHRESLWPLKIDRKEQRFIDKVFDKDGKRQVSQQELMEAIYSKICPPVVHDFFSTLQKELQEYKSSFQDQEAVDLRRVGALDEERQGPAGLIKDKETLVFSALSACMITSAMAPLERLKIMMQVQAQHKTFTGVYQGISKIIQEEGFQSLWRGNGLNIMRILPMLGIQYAAYQFLKKKTENSDDLELRFWTEDYLNFFKGEDMSVESKHLLTGMVAGLVAGALIHPIDVIRARATATRGGPAVMEKGILHFTQQVIQKEGYNVLLRGLAPALTWSTIYMGLSLPTLVMLKPLIKELQPPANRLDLESLVLSDHALRILTGVAAGVGAHAVAHPFDVIRRKMQVCSSSVLIPQYNVPKDFSKTIKPTNKVSNALTGFSKTAKNIYYQEGIRGFYRGFTPAILKFVPTITISYVLAIQLV